MIPAPASKTAAPSDATAVTYPAELPAVGAIPPVRDIASIQAQLVRMQEIVSTIRVDMAADVERFDGAPLDGRTVAEIHAHLAAAVVGLANCIEVLARALAG